MRFFSVHGLKGRDWFDFLWFCSRGIKPKPELLASSLNQSGPWAGERISISPDWLKRQLSLKIRSIDWEHAVRDISPFLFPEDRKTLDAWKVDFFIHYLNRMY